MTATQDGPDHTANRMAELQALIVWMDHYLDADVADTYQGQPLAQDWARVAKAGEEAGEAIDALIGMTGQNPRKGRYGGLPDLLDELADVALTGLYAIQHFTKSGDGTVDVLMQRARYHRHRVQGLDSGQRITPPEGGDDGSEAQA